jgi:hypothetical protein
MSFDSALDRAMDDALLDATRNSAQLRELVALRDWQMEGVCAQMSTMISDLNDMRAELERCRRGETDDPAIPNTYCSICCEDSIKLYHTLPCGHTFHIKCVMEWFRRNGRCPMCREEPAAMPRYQQDALAVRLRMMTNESDRLRAQLSVRTEECLELRGLLDARTRRVRTQI